MKKRAEELFNQVGELYSNHVKKHGKPNEKCKDGTPNMLWVPVKLLREINDEKTN